MKSQVNQGEKSQLILEVEVSMAEMEPELKVAGKKIARQINIPGFRKGKVPYAVLENYIGAEAIMQEAAEDIIAKAYDEALEENDIKAVARPQIEVTQMEKDKPLIFKAIVTIRPEVELGQYKELSLNKVVYEVTEEDIEAELQKSRERLARVVDAPADAKVEKGDKAVISFKGFIYNKPFKGGSFDDYSLEVGSGSFIPGFEEQLIGMAAGESKDVNVTFPEDYPQKKLAGKPALFKVTLSKIKRKELPEANDAFAKELSENCNTMADLLSDIKMTLMDDKDSEAQDMAISAGIQMAVDNATVEIPDSMIEERLELLIMELESKFRGQGINFDEYLKYAKIDREQLKKEYRPQAENEIKLQLVLEAIAKSEDLEVTEEDIEKQLYRLAEKSWKSVESIRASLESQGAMPELKTNILCNKAGKLIYDKAAVTEEHITKAEAEARAAQAIADEAAQAAAAIEDLDKEAEAAQPEAKKEEKTVKAAAKKSAAKKTAATKEETAEEKPKKTATKKAAAPKAEKADKAEKAEKPAAKKPAAKKPAAKKEDKKEDK
jgi:trigger factor